MNPCFIQYFLTYELISHVVIALLSLLLAVKLLIWNKCSKSAKSESLTRANRLALLDALITLLFDIVPAVLMTKLHTGKLEDTGPVLALSKMSGYALEGCLVIRALGRINGTQVGATGKSLSRVKPSNSAIAIEI
ncbi:hypothetical protein GCK72_019487 [Caenorhabditis remanei]|uniref:Uncharacterized protein n=1 Tax=Caenorhabditis remanei TaxID=31234 RepID=A0A6A5GEL6_CAERE|nr:hypothetical protein GCK72_019487 [Caenorhabditis remanei]KAF1752932.1 hypothetical protein GCK72_019487 [Caenorhabditis remanei]